MINGYHTDSVWVTWIARTWMVYYIANHPRSSNPSHPNRVSMVAVNHVQIFKYLFNIQILINQ